MQHNETSFLQINWWGSYQQRLCNPNLHCFSAKKLNCTTLTTNISHDIEQVRTFWRPACTCIKTPLKRKGGLCACPKMTSFCVLYVQDLYFDHFKWLHFALMEWSFWTRKNCLHIVKRVACILKRIYMHSITRININDWKVFVWDFNRAIHVCIMIKIQPLSISLRPLVIKSCLIVKGVVEANKKWLVS